MTNSKQNILSLKYEDLALFLESLGMKKFNAKQVFQWLHEKNIRKFEEMTNISAADRAKIAEFAYIPYLEMLQHKISKKDHTEKYLFELEDKLTIETVLIKHKDRRTVCVSTQVGCPIQCAFCATGINGFKRNLTQAEILNQVYFIQKRLSKNNDRVTNIVFMGMGEPMLNLENVINAIKILSSPDGVNVSIRKIVISTSGLVPGILQLIEEKLPVGLAISLHSALDAKRDEIVPVNRKYPLDDLFSILNEYQKQTKRRITFEYILLKDFNISYNDADILASRIRGIDHTLNLIPYNPVEGSSFERPGEDKIKKFFEYLHDKLGVNVTMRQERGTDIKGACGQLRQRHSEVEK